MSFRDKVRDSLHRWVDGVGRGGGSGGVAGLNVSLPDVRGMAGDVVAEADQAGQEREYQKSQAEQGKQPS